jgi:CheY-like chemotaxis protein
LERLGSTCDVVSVDNADRALDQAESEHFDGLLLADGQPGCLQLEHLLFNERILQSLPEGVALLDTQGRVVWANQRLLRWMNQESAVGQSFLAALNCPGDGADNCVRITDCLATGRTAVVRYKTPDNRYYLTQAAPVKNSELSTDHLIVAVRDVTKESLQEQKLDAILKAGKELADLTGEEVASMQVDERKELLKSNILHFTKHLLNFDVVEIRLLDRNTGSLKSLLAEGLTRQATQRDLFAMPHDNGVTGWVAANGKSYLCDDTTCDPLFLEGCLGARSSLTVPLVLADEVVGTFNVESPQPRAFGTDDLRFLEIFSRDVAAAIHTLDLLEVEKANTAKQNVEAIHRCVALPVDEILNDVVSICEKSQDLDPEVFKRLSNVLRSARNIKQIIQSVGQSLAPAEAQLSPEPADADQPLCGKRILVVDADDTVRSCAHQLLEPQGCVVETARCGTEAVSMERNLLAEGGYDVIVADIKLPDMNGYQLMLKLKEIVDPPPLVLMTGFGYDAGHSLVNARKAGLPSYAQVFKPFKPDQVFATITKVLEAAPRGVA